MGFIMGIHRERINFARTVLVLGLHLTVTDIDVIILTLRANHSRGCVLIVRMCWGLFKITTNSSNFESYYTHMYD